MNGMKLGTNQKAKNSFAFQNEFLNYEDQEFDEDEYEDQSQSHQPTPVQNNRKIPVQTIQNKSKVAQLNIKKPQNATLTQKQQKQQKQVKQNSKNKNQVKKQPIDERISQLNQGFQKLSVSILDLKQNYSTLQKNQQMYKNRSPKKEQQIKQYLHQKQQQKKIILQRKRIQEEKQRKKLEQSLKLEQIEKANKEKKKMEDNLRKINQIRERRSAEKQKAVEKEKAVSKLYEKLYQDQNNVKKFHFRKMEEDQELKIRELEDRKRILAERKQAFRSIDISELEQHRKKHDQVINQLLFDKKVKRQDIIEEIQRQNQKFDELYRGQSHDYVEDQIEQRRIKRRAPKQKLRKMKEYQKIVRENYLPKTQRPSARKYIDDNSRQNKSHREVRGRYQYVNGVAQGEVFESHPIPLSQKDLKKKGNENLAYLRSLPKKRILEEQNIERSLSPQDIAILDKKLNSIVRVKKQRNPLYERKDHHSIDFKLSSNPTRDQVTMIFSQLKSKDEQTKQKQKLLKHQVQNSDELGLNHKKINQEIVRNIQQKLNLLAKL